MSPNEALEKFTDQCVEACKERNLTSYKSISDFIFGEIWRDYEGRASKDKCKAVADDVAESVCLKLGIAVD